MEDKYANYLNFIEDAKNYNRNLFVERRLRLPFLDSHTGIAQVDCCLWRHPSERRTNLPEHQQKSGKLLNYKLISYPTQKWCKKRRCCDSTLDSGNKIARNQTVVEPSEHHQIAHANESQQSSATSLSDTLSQSSNDQTGSTTSYQLLNMDFNSSSNNNHDAVVAIADQASNHMRSESSTNCLANDAIGEHHDNHQTNSSLYSQSLIKPNSTMETSNLSSKLVKVKSNGCTKADEQTPDQLRLEEQTKIAIKLQSKISKKKKNVGQSLIRTTKPQVNNQQDSATINNGTGDRRISFDLTKTTIQNNNIEQTTSSETHSDSRLNSNNAQITPTSIIHESRVQKPILDKKELANFAIICSNASRPYMCTICDQTYKTRPGLTYHFQHSHKVILPRNLPAKINSTEEQRNCSLLLKNNQQYKSSKIQKTKTSNKRNTVTKRDTSRSILAKRKSSCESNDRDKVDDRVDMIESTNCVRECENNLGGNLSDDASTIVDDMSPRISSRNGYHEENETNNDHEQQMSNGHNQKNVEKATDAIDKTRCHLNNNIGLETRENETTNKSNKQNLFCDFCLGTAERNRRTRQPEELLSCSRCGSSGHPTCLRFSDNILNSVKSYDWQCIDCKTCSSCNNADNEDKLLFCDDCDRSYHTYCLKPPLTELPEGNWSCVACLAEYHKETLT